MLPSDAQQDLLASFGRFVPQDFLQLLGISDFRTVQIGDQIEKKLTVMFSDIRNFTTLSESLGPQKTFAFLNDYLGIMVPIIRQHKGFVDKYIGDAILALFPGGENHALQAALDMLAALNVFNQQRHVAGMPDLGIGIGLNTGIVILGTIGTAERMETTVIGDTVNLASRLESMCKSCHVPLLISEHTLMGLSTPLRRYTRFVDRVRVKGKLRPESVYEAFGHQSASLIEQKLLSLESFEKGVAYYHMQEVAQAQALFETCQEICPQDEIVDLYLQRCQRWLASGYFEGTGELELDLDWKATNALGVPEIDAQHQQLFRITSQLLHAVHQGTEANWPEVLDFLENYIAQHFQTEEQLMKQYDYPFLAEHQYAHRAFVDNYLHLRKEIQSGRHDRLYLLFKIDLFLADWLINHTTKDDLHWSQFIFQAGYVPKPFAGDQQPDQADRA